jgi:hypothetical protein
MNYEETLRGIRDEVGSCREWKDEKFDRCNAPSEYVLWGKLLPPEALGPRCYDCAVKHVPSSALTNGSSWALINIERLARHISQT